MMSGTSAVIDFGCVSSRILWVKIKISRVKVCVVAGMTPLRVIEGRDRFWNDLGRDVDRIGSG